MSGPGAHRDQNQARRGVRSLGDDLAQLWPALLASRLVVALAWWLAGGLGEGEPTARLRHEGLLAWDGAWYREIAVQGYAELPTEGLRFFPLYPLMADLLAVPFGDAAVSVALVLVANLAAVATAVLVRRLVLAEKGDSALATRAAALVALFPSGFVLVWTYSEALFLVATVGGLLACRSRRWGWAALAGLAAGATRPLGLLLLLPFAIEAFGGWRAAGRSQRLSMVTAVAAPVVGAGAYLAWVWERFGDALLPFTVQGDFRGDANPVERIVRGVGDLVGAERWGDGLHVPFAVAFVVLAVLVFRYWPLSFGVFAAAMLVVALAADNLNSLERYALNAFPLVLALAVVCSTQRRERLALAVGACGLLSLATLAWMGLYVP